MSQRGVASRSRSRSRIRPPLCASKGFPTSGICFLCKNYGHTSLHCHLKQSGARLGYRCISASNYDDYCAGRGWVKEMGDMLTPMQHVSFGNLKTPSRWFSASESIDPAFFWSTRVALDGKVSQTQGRNWDTAYIAVVDLNLCEIFADVSNGPLASAHGINDRRELDLAISNREVILRAVPHEAILSVRSVQDIICNPNADRCLHDAGSAEACARWTGYAQWAERGRYKSATRPEWLPG